MRAVAVVVMAMLTSGCWSMGWDDVPTSRVRLELAASYDVAERTYWWGQVAAAVSTWNQAAAEAGCEQLFVITEDADAHPIRLIDHDAWRHGDGTIGKCFDEDHDGTGSIDVLEQRPGSAIPVVIHELGHAIGLDHNEDPTSVMTLRSAGLTKLGAVDVAAMIDQVGCAPSR